ncbi:sensor domain-containing diguanylate cyclase [Acinetobacter indicus]|nr:MULTISPECIES: sensor domain-containing diguanylate cyclase [Acinetobacter]MCP0915890.1 sensor domain-containing diguanylate cyclase [Acinetobacter indicus]MCP0919017.1 sensor domain-containing diguanylate cyclase [Acinetobacter indicus]MCP0921683.1 sensor domain-containing diguanylate cyclase [Acinetobacter indicus]QSQ94609.1 GGDEF domain-containing protein [Acinetobacter indicus]
MSGLGLVLLKRLLLSLRLNLRKLILYSTILSVSGLFVVSLFILNYVIKDQLIQNSLSVNEKYAEKIAVSANQHFSDMLKELEYSAKQLEQDIDNPELIYAEVKRLKYQSDNFNSILLVDPQQQMLAYAPKSLALSFQQTYSTPGIIESLQQKKTYISSPYWSVNGNLVILMSQPIYNGKDNYLGMISGSIYLQRKNLLNTMLNTQYDYKKSYMYVIDQHNRIIFHPDKNRIGEKIINNTGLDFINQHKNGSIRLKNSLGIDNLAGFAHIPSVNWIVVSQQPTEDLLAQANTLILKVSIGIFIFYFFIFLLIWYISSFISSPLNRLARMASMLNHADIENKIKEVDPWYFEVLKFRTSLLMSSETFSHRIAELKHHVNTDPLTGLYNRRGMQLFLNELLETRTEFAVLAIDIDFFKKINDQYGHDQGDVVLKTLAQLMLTNFREQDICCRSGGEEFLVLMTTADASVAYKAAERLRKTMQETTINQMGQITISIGIAFWPKDAVDVAAVLKIADNKLYEAKHSGRNCIRSTVKSSA